MCATSNDQNIRRAPLKKENKVFMLISHSYGGRKRNFNILTHMLADGQIRLVLQFVKVLQIHDSEENVLLSTFLIPAALTVPCH